MRFCNGACLVGDLPVEIDGYLKRLFPICRSITGNGNGNRNRNRNRNRDTLRTLQELIPLTGRFEDMYRDSSDVPWYQGQAVNAVFSDLTVALVRRRRPKTLLDVGYGLGYMTARPVLSRNVISKAGYRI